MIKTNAQEREALAKIREILEDFSPEDTYVGKAFEGCVEQAEENIRNDWMLSWKHRYEAKANSVEGLLNANTELKRTLNQRDDTIARLNAMNEDAGREMSSMTDERIKLRREGSELRCKLAEATKTSDGLKQTILELKAKLYDMMTAGEEVKE